jgi:heme/copper-type cytochrome/quinol oxidase subunit 1
LKIKQKPYHLLLLTGIMFFLVSFFVMKKGLVTDFHFHDTYFVIAHTHIFWLFAMILLVIWTLYLLVNKLLYSKGLTWTHIIITILTSALLLFLLFPGDDTANLAPRRYYDFSTWNSHAMFDNHMKVVAITISILLCGQIIFLINLIAGLFKHRLSRPLT